MVKKVLAVVCFFILTSCSDGENFVGVFVEIDDEGLPFFQKVDDRAYLSNVIEISKTHDGNYITSDSDDILHAKHNILEGNTRRVYFQSSTLTMEDELDNGVKTRIFILLTPYLKQVIDSEISGINNAKDQSSS